MVVFILVGGLAPACLSVASDWLLLAITIIIDWPNGKQHAPSILVMCTVLEISRPLANIWPTKIQPNFLYIFSGTAVNNL